MNMKKISALVLALAMAMSLCVSASATAIDPSPAKTTIDSLPGYHSFDVTGKYVNNNDPTYSVDITWGSMVFTYTINDTAVWDPVKHEYTAGTGESVGTWSCDNGADKVTVTNNSNAQVKVNTVIEYPALLPGETLPYTVSLSGIDADKILASAENNSDGLSVTGTVSVSGTLDNSAATSSKRLCSIKIVLDKVD